MPKQEYLLNQSLLTIVFFMICPIRSNLNPSTYSGSYYIIKNGEEYVVVPVLKKKNILWC